MAGGVVCSFHAERSQLYKGADDLYLPSCRERNSQGGLQQVDQRCLTPRWKPLGHGPLGKELGSDSSPG